MRSFFILFYRNLKNRFFYGAGRVTCHNCRCVSVVGEDYCHLASAESYFTVFIVEAVKGAVLFGDVGTCCCELIGRFKAEELLASENKLNIGIILVCFKDCVACFLCFILYHADKKLVSAELVFADLGLVFKELLYFLKGFGKKVI